MQSECVCVCVLIYVGQTCAAGRTTYLTVGTAGEVSAGLQKSPHHWHLRTESGGTRCVFPFIFRVLLVCWCLLAFSSNININASLQLSFLFPAFIFKFCLCGHATCLLTFMFAVFLIKSSGLGHPQFIQYENRILFGSYHGLSPTTHHPLRFTNK